MSEAIWVVLRVVGIVAALALLVHRGPRLFAGSIAIALGLIGFFVSVFSLSEDGAAQIAWVCAGAVIAGAVLVVSGLHHPVEPAESVNERI